MPLYLFKITIVIVLLYVYEVLDRVYYFNLNGHVYKNNYLSVLQCG
jgi:hypothetical protein